MTESTYHTLIKKIKTFDPTFLNGTIVTRIKELPIQRRRGIRRKIYLPFLSPGVTHGRLTPIIRDGVTVREGAGFLPNWKTTSYLYPFRTHGPLPASHPSGSVVVE